MELTWQVWLIRDAAVDIVCRKCYLLGHHAYWTENSKCQLPFGVMDFEDQDLVMREVKVSRSEIGQVVKLHGRTCGQMRVPGSVTVQESPVSPA